MERLKYFALIVTLQNFIQEEIKTRLNLEILWYYSLQGLLTSLPLT